MASGSYTLPYGFKPPSESYVFDNLIADLSQAISEQELENLKKRFERKLSNKMKMIRSHTFQTNLMHA
jgi:L-2-hydroxyglutarate oxidase LhgO